MPTHKMERSAACFVRVVMLLVLFLPFLVQAEGRGNFYELEAVDLQGKTVHFSQFRGQVVLITNVALKCGTTPQLSALQKLYDQHRSQKFVILAFPSDDFTGSAEPKEPGVIKKTCALKYGVEFPVFQITSVKGRNAHPVFHYLTSAGSDEDRGEVTFNFEKFLVDKTGRVRRRFGSFTGATSDVLERELQTLLDEQTSES